MKTKRRTPRERWQSLVLSEQLGLVSRNPLFGEVFLVNWLAMKASQQSRRSLCAKIGRASAVKVLKNEVILGFERPRLARWFRQLRNNVLSRGILPHEFARHCIRAGMNEPLFCK
jgi:hypothetical protein